MLLGDVGGLYGLLMSVGSTIIGITNYKQAENQLASELFKVDKSE